MKYPKICNKIISGFYLMFHNCPPYFKVNVIITYLSQYKKNDVYLFIYIVHIYFIVNFQYY